jgi:phosphopantetheine--protein transferase-like protein
MRGLLLGADLVDVREVEEALVAFGDRYVGRIYTPTEIAYAMKAPGETARRLGARFAAKEATIKALRASEEGIDPRSIEVIKAPDGGCEVALSGTALIAAHRSGVADLTVSMSHQGSLAMAVVVAQRTRASSTRLSYTPHNAGLGPAGSPGFMKDQIRSILKQHARLAIDLDDLKDDSDLYQAGMTSHASVNVMLALEGAFDTEFPDRMLRRGVFESVEAISAAVEELTKGR